MKTKTFKCLTIGGCSIALVGSAIFAANTQLSVNLSDAVQHIERVVFATLNNGHWKQQGQVEVVADNALKTISINGSLITNVEQQGSTDKYKGSANVSILGGSQNSTQGESTMESTIIGGENNTIDSSQVFIGGGRGNKIADFSFRSTILGGDTNSIAGETSTIIGGSNNTINANNSIIIGNNNNV